MVPPLLPASAATPPAFAPGSAAIEAVDLRKSYRLQRPRRARASTDSGHAPEVVEAVRGVSLQIASGEIYALLGPNGAGKTTLLSMLTTLLEPTGGSARIVGFDVVAQPAEVRRRIGVTFQEVVLDEELTGRQVLDFHGRLYGMPAGERKARLLEVAALVELTQVLDRSAAGYSGGMKRRLELARGLMTQPSVLFLDEPTQGLDPQNRAGVWRYVRTLREQLGMTILLTTHYMEEAEALADRVGIIDHGRLVLEGAPAALVHTLGADIVRLSGAGDQAMLQQRLATLPFVQKVTNVRGRPPEDDARNAPAAGDQRAAPAFRMQIGVDNGDRRIAELVTLAVQSGVQILEMSVARPSLGDLFLAHTGGALRDAAEG